RIELLISRLQKAREKIVIPTPALSEILIRAGAETSGQIVEYINKYAIFRIEAFDARAAIELAAISREALRGKNKRGASNAVWAKVKFDRQIVAIAKVAGATEIYSDDFDVATLAKKENIKCISVADLPLPTENAQFQLNLEGHADVDKPSIADEDESRPTA
ncbi:MAG: hypothetical protein J0H17_07890, partial [Rhizobiales bacterium]|nr:hypothetical protein [Hyphomicrobiales bacterium]